MSLASELIDEGKRAPVRLQPYYPVKVNRFYYGAMDSFSCFVYVTAMRALHPATRLELQSVYYSIATDEGIVWC